VTVTKPVRHAAATKASCAAAAVDRHAEDELQVIDEALAEHESKP
jgi:hypothetical protein